MSRGKRSTSGNSKASGGESRRMVGMWQRTVRVAGLTGALLLSNCQGHSRGADAGSERDATPTPSALSTDAGVRACAPLSRQVDVADWTSAMRNLCAPTDEWPWEVNATQSCFEHRAISVSRADSSDVYFFSKESGVLTGVLRHYSLGRAPTTICTGEVPSGDPATCGLRPVCP